MIFRSYSWSNGQNIVLQLGLGFGTGNGYCIPFFFFPYLKLTNAFSQAEEWCKCDVMRFIRDGVHGSLPLLRQQQYHIMEPFLLPLRSYSAGCCIQRVGLNRARHAQSLLEASKEIAKGNRHASAWNKISGTFYMFNQLSLSSYITGCSQPWPCKPPSELHYTPAA